MTKLRIYYPDGADGYANWMPFRPVDKIESADILGLSGGADVSPARYNRLAHESTYTSPERDRVELAAIQYAKAQGMPIVGTCRGSQLLCVAAGGILVQDVRHPGAHNVTTFDGKTILVNSLHHQMQHPWDLQPNKFKVLAWAEGLSPYHCGESDNDELVIGKVEGNKEVEIAYYPEIHALAIQSHPEMVFWRYDQSEEVRKSIDYMRGLLLGLINRTL